MKKSWITWVVIFGVIFLAIFILIKPPAVQVDAETAKCIGANSILYVQLGCSHCEDQEEMFGGNYQYLNVVDCFFESEKCADITATPTWIINQKKYTSVQTIDKLKELTGC